MKKQKEFHVLMCGSDLKQVKGGMVTVAAELMDYDHWDKVKIHYIPTHVEGSKLKKALLVP